MGQRTLVAQLGHAAFEADPGPQRRLLEQQPQHVALQQRLADAAEQLALDRRGAVQHQLDFLGGEVEQRDEISHASPPQACCCRSTSARISKP